MHGPTKFGVKWGVAQHSATVLEYLWLFFLRLPTRTFLPHPTHFRAQGLLLFISLRLLFLDITSVT